MLSGIPLSSLSIQSPLCFFPGIRCWSGRWLSHYRPGQTWGGGSRHLFWTATPSLFVPPSICSSLSTPFSQTAAHLPIPLSPLSDMPCGYYLPAHHLGMFLTHVKAHEQGPYNHHHNKDHHHNHDEQSFQMHGAAGDAELAPGTC